MRITESRLRRIIRSVILESAMFQYDDDYKMDELCRNLTMIFYALDDYKHDLDKPEEVQDNSQGVQRVLDELIKDNLIEAERVSASDEENYIKKEDVINLTELTHLNEAIKVYCKNYLFDGANDMDLCESYDRMLLLEKKIQNLNTGPRPEAVQDHGDDGQDLNYTPNRDYDYSPSLSDDYKPQSR